jgi:hypothetical protein
VEAVIGVQEVPEFIMTSAEVSCRVNGTEATHWPIAALDPSMILLNAVVEILAVPVADIWTKLASNRMRVTVMPVGGHPGGVTPVTVLADRKNFCAAAISRVSLSITSTSAPVRSIARYR